MLTLQHTQTTKLEFWQQKKNVSSLSFLFFFASAFLFKQWRGRVQSTEPAFGWPFLFDSNSWGSWLMERLNLFAWALVYWNSPTSNLGHGGARTEGWGSCCGNGVSQSVELHLRHLPPSRSGSQGRHKLSDHITFISLWGWCAKMMTKLKQALWC